MKKSLWIMMGCLIFCCAALGISRVSVRGARVDICDLELPETAVYGSAFTLPEVNIDAGGEKKAASAALVYPSGIRTTDARVTLSEAGRYTLEFTAEAGGGKTYRETRSFRVDYPMYELSATTGTVAYGAHPSAPAASGLVVDVKTGGAINFNKVVDLSALTARDALFETFVTPKQVGAADFNAFQLVLTDAYDANNYVTIALVNQEANAHMYSYAKAGAARQSLTGVEIWNGEEKVHVNDYYGTPVRTTFQGSANPASNKFTISLDYASRTVYCNGEKVVDLDSVAYFTDLWAGFTTGDVRLSFRPTEGSDARCVITEVFGMDLAAETVTDGKAPRISVDYGEYAADSLPLAEAKKPYKLFEASALDSYVGECKVSRKVYLNYYSSNPVEFYLTEGAFTPSRGGTYTAVYSASDRFGNTSEITMDITAKSALDEIALDLSSLSLSGRKAGVDIDLDGVSATGGSGRKLVTFAVSHPAGESAYRLTERGFKPLLVGVYTLTFTATDYIGGAATESLKVEVGENRDPMVEKEAAIPECFLEGFNYRLPEMEAVSYYGGVSAVSSTVTVTDANGTRRLDGNAYTPKVAADGDEVTLVYTAETATGSVSRTYTVPCYRIRSEDGALDYRKYFRADGGVYEIANNNSYTVFKYNGDATVRYLNALLWPSFEITCRIPSAAGRAVFRFADSADPSDTFEFELVQRNGKVYLQCCDQEFETNVEFGKNFTVRYDGSLNKLFIETVGYEPEGLKLFASGKVNFSWRLEELTGMANFRLVRLNQQTMNDNTKDQTAPRVALLGSSGGCYAPGSMVSTLTAVWGDVLDPDADCLVTVRDPNGDVVVSEDGVRLENVSPAVSYRIRLSSYGVYAVEYVPKDSAGNSATMYDRFRVWDSMSPEITVENAPISGKAGVEIVLPEAAVSDDYSRVTEYFVSYFAPDGQVHYVSAANGVRAFTPAKKGSYRVVYYCFDGNGNMGAFEFVITVS